MARRSDHSKDALLKLALDEGEGLLREVGLSGFSARGVAARMGYTVGTLYHLFGNLDGFFIQLNARTLDVWYEYMCQSVEKAKLTKEHAILALAQSYLLFAQNNQHVWLTLFEHRLPEGEDIPAWMQAKMQRFFDLLENELRNYMPADDVPQRARLLWSGIHGVVMLSLQNKLDVAGDQSPEEMCQTMVAALLK